MLLQAVRGRARELWDEVCLAELSGALGDLGTFLPLLIAMGVTGSIDFANALFWAGLFNIFTGVMWDSPMPVQPMKTIAAVAISEGLTQAEVIGAGIGTGAIVLFLGVTGLIDLVNWFTPTSVVRGLQVGLGFSMLHRGLEYVVGPSLFESGADSTIVGVACIVFTLFSLSFRGGNVIPAALVLFTVGGSIAAARSADQELEVFHPELPITWTAPLLNGTSFVSGLVRAGLPQVPLTTLNSVVSVCDLNSNLFPNKPISRRSVATSVALMNLVGLWFGAMPLCHGAGGLAAQYRFGARGGASVVFLGILKVLFAIVLGSGSAILLGLFPTSVLGALLLFAGLGLGVAGAKRRAHSDDSIQETTTILATAAVTISLKTLVGCIAGLVVAAFNGQFDHVGVAIKDRWLRAKQTYRGGSSGVWKWGSLVFLWFTIGSDPSKEEVPETMNQSKEGDQVIPDDVQVMDSPSTVASSDEGGGAGTDDSIHFAVAGV